MPNFQRAMSARQRLEARGVDDVGAPRALDELLADVAKNCSDNARRCGIQSAGMGRLGRLRNPGIALMRRWV